MGKDTMLPAMYLTFVDCCVRMGASYKDAKIMWKRGIQKCTDARRMLQIPACSIEEAIMLYLEGER